MCYNRYAMVDVKTLSLFLVFVQASVCPVLPTRRCHIVFGSTRMKTNRTCLWWGAPTRRSILWVDGERVELKCSQLLTQLSSVFSEACKTWTFRQWNTRRYSQEEEGRGVEGMRAEGRGEEGRGEEGRDGGREGQRVLKGVSELN